MTGQRCPICSAEVPASPRYPNYLCDACAARASSSDGRLAFANAGLSGGFVATYADNGAHYDGHVCVVDGIRCLADEARFGGIVIQPDSGA